MSDRPVSRRSARVGRVELPDPLVGGPAGAVQLSRRDLLGRIALAAGTLGASGLLAACGAGSGGQGRQPVAGSLRALVGNVQQLSLLNAQSQLPAGRSRFAFGLAAENNRLVQGVAPKVWLAKDQTSKALGPYPARWLQMTGYDRTGDRSPRSELTGFYVAEVDLPAPGNWLAVALVEVASQRAAAQGTIPVRQQVVAQVGTKARSGPTPVATSPSQMVAFQRLGTSKANFIHLEIYPQRDTNKPAPLFTTWGFQSEPWMLVIDRAGFIRGRLGEGPVVAPEIEAALQPLLS